LNPRSDGPPTVHLNGTRSATAHRTLAAALLAVFVGALDLTVIATILPPMIFDLNVNTADVDRYIWVVTGYLLAYLVAIPIMGRVSDLVGRQTAFFASLTIFLVGSVWCVLASDLSSLIVGRAIQGAGGGALLPVTMALVGDLYPPARRAAMLGLVGAVDTLGWVLGPLWGAALVGAFGGRDDAWRIVFGVNVPLGLLAAAAIAWASRSAPAREQVRTSGRLDVVGVVLLGATLLVLNLGLASGGELGGVGSGMRALGGTRNPLSAYLVPLVVTGVLLGAVFVWWERRTPTPALPLSLFRIRTLSAALIANFVVGAALIVAMVDVPVVVALLVAQEEVSATSALMLAPFTLLMAAVSFAGGMLAERFGTRVPAGVGLVLVSLGYVALWLGLDGDGYTGMLPGLALAGAGFGLVLAPIGTNVLNAAPAPDRGIAAATTLLFRLLGMTIGISALTAFGVRRLQALTGRLEPVVPRPNEATSDFLARQQLFIEEHAIPLSILVVRETFLIAALLALLALIPIRWMRPPSNPAGVEASRPTRSRLTTRARPETMRSPR
jgi:EmrB/QacA subfamily drug resistance transporter